MAGVKNHLVLKSTVLKVQILELKSLWLVVGMLHGSNASRMSKFAKK